MVRDYLKEGEYIGHEVYFPSNDPPQEIIDRLKDYGFIQSKDGFYIPREAFEIFKVLAYPYKVDIMQDNIILGDGDPYKTMNEMLDIINQLKVAGIQGIDNFIEKIKKNS